MRIGILTLPLSYNYGGILQAYALQTILESIGHEVVVVDKDRYLPDDLYHQARSVASCLLHRTNKNLKTNWAYNRAKKEREKYTRAFIDSHIKTYRVKNMASEFPHDVEAIVVGSDQIWRRKYYSEMIGGGIENAFLSFTKGWDIKRLAYAASFGTDEWEYSTEESKLCKHFLQFFDAVGVREESGVNLCSKWLGRNDAKHVLDPTLLLKKDDYVSLLEGHLTSASEGNMMVYVLDGTMEKLELVQRIAKERHLIPFNANVSDDKFKQNPKLHQPPLENWLRGFMDAEFIVTDSFHACIFSIIFNKPFIVVGNEKRGLSRFESLLSMFSLDKHLLRTAEDYQSDSTYLIDDKAYEELEKRREASLHFLSEALK